VGDCILLAQLAYRLGRTLTKNRKGASATYEEVQRQLSTLSNALAIVGSQTRDNSVLEDEGYNSGTSTTGARSQDEQDNLAQDEHFATMIRSCKETLKRLEDLCDKYKCLDESTTDVSAQAKLRGNGFRGNVKKQFKKVHWTMEDKELGEIQKDLNVHLDALNLTIGGMNK
jgi:hypothetical protein